MTVNQLSATVTVEVHPNLSRQLKAETETQTKPDRLITRILDKKTGDVLATVRQPEQPATRIHFLQAKGGFFALVTTDELTYIAMPGSQLQLEDTLLHMPGELFESGNTEASPHTLRHAQTVTDQAMILGAGLASRFVPVSGDLTGYSKPSVPLVGDDSVIVTLAKHMRKHGFKRILVNTYYKPEILKAQLQQTEGIEFAFIDEDKPSGTAGGLLKALEWGMVDRSKPILIMQGDAVTDGDLSTLIETHGEKAPLATVGVKHIRDEEVPQMAIVVTDRSGKDGESGYVQSFKEKPTLAEAGPSRLASIGFYVLSPQVMDEFVEIGKSHWVKSGEFDYAFHFFPTLLERHHRAIYARMIPQPFYWSDIGRPDQYIATIRDIYTGKLQIDLPPDADQYLHDGVVFWEDAHSKAAARGAILKGNMIVLNRRA